MSEGQMSGAGRWRLDCPLALPPRLRLESFARRAGLHPELVRRFVALGLVDAARDGTGELWFSWAELGTVARVQRLRAGLPLNYAAVGLVCDLLDRIQELEAALRAASPGARPRPGPGPAGARPRPGPGPGPAGPGPARKE